MNKIANITFPHVHLSKLEVHCYNTPAIDCCTLTSDIASCQRLRSATRHQLNVPQHCCSRFGRRTFSVAGPRTGNLLPGHLRDPSLSSGSFRPAPKTYLFTTHRNTQRSRGVLCNALYKSTIIIVIINDWPSKSPSHTLKPGTLSIHQLACWRYTESTVRILLRRTRR